MTDIYEQHRAAFKRVSAYIVMHGGERVATVAFKFPADGAGRLWAYVHWLGVPMVRGGATGGGYDKRTAACAAAVGKLRKEAVNPDPHWAREAYGAFIEALKADRGPTWDSALHKAGFNVFQAV